MKKKLFENIHIFIGITCHSMGKPSYYNEETKTLTVRKYFDDFAISRLKCATNLFLEDKFNESIDLIPDNILSITFGELYDLPYNLEFGYSFNSTIGTVHRPCPPIKKLPKNLLFFTTGSEFDQPIGIGLLPNSLTNLTLGYSFDQPIKKGTMPSSLTHLTLGYSFDRPIKKGTLPSSLTHLTLGYSFDQPIKKGTLPSSLTHLTLGYSFNQPFEEETLPSTITHLTLGAYFDQPIKEGTLPSSLTHLTFDYWSCFNQPLNKGSLPSTITHLNFGYVFTQPFEKDSLPSSLTFLKLAPSFDGSIQYLPNGLTHLIIGDYRTIGTISEFMFSGSLDVIPKSVKYLMIETGGYVSTDDIPDHIEYLAINFTTGRIIDNLPINLKKLIINDEKYMVCVKKKPFGCEVVVDRKLSF